MRKLSDQQMSLLRHIAEQGGAVHVDEGFNRRTAWSLVNRGCLKTDGSVGVYAGKSYSGLTFVLTEAAHEALKGNET
jgi:hypothetical protein